MSRKLTKAEKEKIEQQKKEAEKQENINKLPVATLEDLMGSKLAKRSSAFTMDDNGRKFKVVYRRLSENEYNELPHNDLTDFDTRIKYYKELIVKTCVEPVFNEVKDVSELDIGLISQLGGKIDTFIFEERFL